MSSSRKIPQWVWACAVLVALGQVAAIGLMLAGKLPGSSRNLVFQALLGGGIAYVLLGGYVLKHHAESLIRPPSSLAIFLLLLFGLGLAALHFRNLRPLLALEYDIAAWSEPLFVVDVVKWRTGSSIYLPPDDSNTNGYGFGAPALTYLLAKISGQATSISAYRWIQLLFLVISAVLATLSAREVLRLAIPDRLAGISRLWPAFFFVAALLFTINPQTCAFNVFLHNDALALAVSAAAFWILLRYAATGKTRWLVAMAGLPVAAFFVKQFLALWAVAYVAFLVMEERLVWRRVFAFSAASFGLVGLVVGVSIALWGENYRYWIFTIMGSHLVSVEKLMGRFSDAAPYLLPGLAGVFFFVRGEGFRKFLGLACGWAILILGALYTSGITYSPTHLGPASFVGLCFALAALAAAWPSGEGSATAEQWWRVTACVACVLLLFGAFGLLWPAEFPVTRDLQRYVDEIDREFRGLPAEKVLLDTGEWPYLRAGVLPKDRMPTLVTHQTPHYGLLGRIERKEYERILVRVLPNGRYSYDLAWDRGITRAIQQHYHHVRTIRPYEALAGWRYRDTMLTEIVVFEPVR